MAWRRRGDGQCAAAAARRCGGGGAVALARARIAEHHGGQRISLRFGMRAQAARRRGIARAHSDAGGRDGGVFIISVKIHVHG